jgi:phage terminase small subunit
MNDQSQLRGKDRPRPLRRAGRSGETRSIPSSAGDATFGPAMAALTEKQRRYVLALFEAPKSHGSLTFAARAAGYGTPTSSKQCMYSMAHAINADPKVQDAIREVSQQYVTILGPHAVRALRKILDNPGHRDHGRALGIVMDRVSPQNSTHTVKVEGEVKMTAQETSYVLQRIEELARKFSVALPAPKIIEHEAV